MTDETEQMEKKGNTREEWASIVQKAKVFREL
jgi:hypothetical protein